MFSKFKAIVRKALHVIDNNRPELDRISRIAQQVDSSAASKATQILLMLQYQALQRAGLPLPKFEDVEFRAFSQNGEDGILHLLFSILGTTNRRCVEIGVGSGLECNTANLIVNHGWEGLLFDGNQAAIKRGQEFYNNCRDTFVWPPQLVPAWITANNINELITKQGFSGEIDLLSIDIDGVDYWIWKAITCIQPRVVVVEYQDIWGPDRAVTVPYSDNFQADFGKHGPDYAGASLAAFVKLGKSKGYRLVGVQRYGFNAFFVRNDLGVDIFPEIVTSDCFSHPKVQYGIKHRLPLVQNDRWFEVE